MFKLGNYMSLRSISTAVVNFIGNQRTQFRLILYYFHFMFWARDLNTGKNAGCETKLRIPITIPDQNE